MCSKDYFFVELRLNLLFEIFNVNRTLCSLCCFHNACSQVNCIKIPFIEFSHIHHESHLWHDDSGATTTVVHADDFYIKIFPALILPCPFCNSLETFQTAAHTTDTFDISACNDCYLFLLLCHTNLLFSSDSSENPS